MTISIILPCYNEEENLKKGVLDKVEKYAESRNDLIEVLIVDDGSKDNSKKIIKDKYLSNQKKFRLIENLHQGKAYAIITGIKRAKGDYILFSDIDLATPIEEAEKLIREAKKGKKIVIGSRSSIRQGAPFLRKLMAIGFIKIRDLLINIKNVKDTQCGFKLFDRATAIQIIERLKVFKGGRQIKDSSVSAGFDLELLFLACKMGHRPREVDVLWRHVETKNVNFVHDSIETLKDIIKIKYYDITGKYEKK